jgi:hypothetical protein
VHDREMPNVRYLLIMPIERLNSLTIHKETFFIQSFFT